MNQTLDSRPVQIVMVTAAHGLDASQYTFNYVAGWAHQAVTPGGPSVEDIIKATGQRVIGATDKILQATQPAPTLAEDALADLSVQVARPIDNVTAADRPATLVAARDADSQTTQGRTSSSRPTPVQAAQPEQVASAVPAAALWERVATTRLDGAARDRQALPPRSTAPTHTVSR